MRGFDLFGLPVNLNYRGRMYFNTCMGGCVSLLTVIGILMYAAMALKSEIMEPQFLQLPAVYDFSKTNTTMDFAANTMAIGVKVSMRQASDNEDVKTQAFTNQMARVEFY